jgi:hypothetical protein
VKKVNDVEFIGHFSAKPLFWKRHIFWIITYTFATVSSSFSRLIHKALRIDCNCQLVCMCSVAVFDISVQFPASFLVRAVSILRAQQYLISVLVHLNCPNFVKSSPVEFSNFPVRQL